MMGTAMQMALEQALADDPDDLAAHRAYADYLSEQADPDLAARGEFIAVQLALEDAGLPAAERQRLQEREKALRKEHERGWLGDLAPFLLDQEGVREYHLKYWTGFGYSFIRGWVDILLLHHVSGPVARATRHPVLRVLRGLEISYHDPDDSGIADFLTCPHLGNLRRFQLGAEEGGECRFHEGECAVELVAKMPKLEELRLLAHRVDVHRLFALPFPHLRTLTVDHLTEYPLEVLANNATLGRLTHLACWPHALNPDDAAAYITFEGARALVRSPHLKALAHLQLRLSDLGDAGCEEIVRSGILKRLKTLDLTGGRVTDAGARTLAACPDLRRLERLELTNNMLTPAGIEALQATGVALEADEQFAIEDADGDREYLREGDME